MLYFCWYLPICLLGILDAFLSFADLFIGLPLFFQENRVLNSFYPDQAYVTWPDLVQTVCNGYKQIT